MYKNLNASVLGISGRQSELIELALTYGFRGVDVNMTELQKRAESRGVDWASRFISSAYQSTQRSKKSVATNKLFRGCGFDLPICWQKSEEIFNQDMAKADALLELCQEMGIVRVQTPVWAANDEAPYHEYFEASRTRLAQIGEKLAGADVKLGLELQAAPSQRQVGANQFIYQAEAILTLINMIDADNVGLALDTWAWRVGEGGLDQLSELPGNRIITVRLADLPDSSDPGSITLEERALPGASGSIDFVALMTMLGEKNYDGPITVFPRPGLLEGARDKVVQRTGDIIESLWHEAGLSHLAKVAPLNATEDEEETGEAEKAEAEKAEAAPAEEAKKAESGESSEAQEVSAES